MSQSKKAEDAEQNVDEVSKWHQQEERMLQDKLLNAKSKPPVIEEKIDNWRALDEFQKKRKCVKKLKSKFKKPMTLLMKLQDIGSDVVFALDEGHRPYWTERLISAYTKARLKLLEAVREAEHLNEAFPEAALAAGNFIWPYEISEVFDGNGALSVVTKEGIRTAEVSDKAG